MEDEVLQDVGHEDHQDGVEGEPLLFQTVHEPVPRETCLCIRAGAAGVRGWHTPPAGGSCSVETALFAPES